MRRQSILVFEILILFLTGCNANEAGDVAAGMTAPIGYTLCSVAKGEPAPFRSQIRTGMTFMQVQKVFGVYIDHNQPDAMDVYSNKLYSTFELVSETEVGRCMNKTYRCWLTPDREGEKTFPKSQPYLLTFQACKLANFEKVQKQCEEIVSTSIKAHPKKEIINSMFKEWNIFDPVDKAILLSLLGLLEPDLAENLPRTMTDDTLKKIELE